MPIAQSADGVLHEFPDGTEPGVIDNAMADYARSTFGPPEPESSTIGAAIRGAERGVIPAAASMAGFGAGAEIGGAAGSFAGPIGAGIGGVLGGLVGAYVAATTAGEAQEAGLNALPEAAKAWLGQSPEQRAADIKAHPAATQIFEMAPMLALMGPGAIKQELPEAATAFQKLMAHPVTAAVTGATVYGGQEAAQEEIEQGHIDPLSVGIAAAGGALMTRPTALGEALTGAGAAPVRALLPTPKGPGPTPEGDANEIMRAPTLDTAIARANAVAGRTPPLDMEGMARAAMEGEPPEEEAARAPDVFGGLNKNTIDQDDTGNWAIKTADAAGNEATRPLRRWDETTPPEPGAGPTISPAMAAAQRDHYAKLGIDVVYFHDDPTIPFDGAVSADHPNTLFLSNNPQRNAAQVGAHEVTHVLESTTLPDGSNLADVLHEQIKAGITPEGRAHAQAQFGATAPARAAFPEGPEGDSEHADAVEAHLIRELGADIGGEAPRFTTFANAVIDKVQERFGADTAKSVLQKFIDGIKNALDTMRTFFWSEKPTVSQRWVTNLAEIHDTLASGYAEKYGGQLGKTTAAEPGPVKAMPVVPNLRGNLDEAALRAHDADLAQQIQRLPAGGQVEADTLTKLDAVQRNLADPNISPEQRRVLSNRRDELLTNTTPEQLRAAAAPIAQRQALTAQRARIADQLGQIAHERRAERISEPGANALFSPKTPEEKRTELVRTVPGLKRVFGNLTPPEQERFRKDTSAKLVRLFSEAPPEQEYASVAYSGRAKRGWYANAAHAISTIFGTEDAPRFTALLAALSPQTSVESNLENASRTWANWTRAGRPTDPKAIKRIMGESVQGSGNDQSVLDAWLGNGTRALISQDPGAEEFALSGAKVNSFAQNLRGYVNEVTNDAWMATFSGLEKDALASSRIKNTVDTIGKTFGVKSPGYLAISAKVRAAARILTKRTGEVWTPAEVQETVWSWAKTLYERRDRAGEDRTTQEILKAADLTHEDIKGASDFASLVLNGVYRKILSEGGYDEPLALLAAEERQRATRLSGPGVAVTSAEGSGITQPAFERHLQSAAARLEAVRNRRLEAEGVDTAPKKPGDSKIEVSLSAATNSIPHIRQLVEAANAGDQDSADFVNLMAHEELQRLVTQIPGAKLSVAEGGGLYGGSLEPSILANIQFPPAARAHVLAALDKFAQTFKQEQIHVRTEVNERLGRVFTDGSYATPVYDIELKQPLTRPQIEKIITDSGLYGITFNDKALKAYYVGDPRDVAAIQQFTAAVERAKNSLGDRGGKAEQSVARLWAYGHGEGATTEYAAIRGELPAGAKQAGREAVAFSPKREEKPFYSALERGIQAINMEKAPPGQWAATIRNMPGVRGEEREWMGVDDWLKRQTKSVTKTELLDHLRENAVEVRDVLKGKGTVADSDVREFHDISMEQWDDSTERERAQMRKEYMDDTGIRNDAKFGSYTLPRGENYHELLLTLDNAKRGERPKTINTLPEGYEIGHDSSQPPEAKYHVLPPGQEHARPFAGRHATPEAAAYTAVGRLNQEAIQRWRDQRQEFRSGHFEEPNVLAHVRFDDRTGPNGEKVLHIAEVQSDWHQKGRKQGYHTAIDPRRREELLAERRKLAEEVVDIQEADKRARRSWNENPEWIRRMDRITAINQETGDGIGGRVPNAPFKTSWHELAMKRMLRYAAENGYDRLSWDTGETQAERYDLSKQVDKIRVARQGDGNYLIAATRPGNRNWERIAADVHEDKLGDHVGKDLATKIVDDKIGAGGQKTYAGLDLKLGGEGMRGFYDKILPDFVNKYTKRWGGKVEPSKIELEPSGFTHRLYEGEPLTSESINARINTPEFKELPAQVQVQIGKAIEMVARGETTADISHQLSPRAAEFLGGRLVERPTEPITAPAHSVAITPAMRKGVMEGQPLFSPKITGADRETEAYTPEQLRAYANVGRITNPPTVRERFDAFTKDWGKRMIRYWLDPYIGVKEADPMGYVALRNANTVSGAIHSFLHDGLLRFEGNAYTMAQRNGGIEGSVLHPLHGEESRFIWWVAAHRAERLSAEGRENLWSQEDIDAIKTTNRGQTTFDYQLPNGAITRNREAIYADTLRKYDVFNKNALDLAVGSGLLNRKQISAFWENPFYVPFFRAAEEDGKFVGPAPSNQFVKQHAFKKLKGGTQELHHDLWENALGNWSHIIDASFRNLAARRVLLEGVHNGSAAEITAQEYEHQLTKAERKNTAVWVMKEGKKQYFQISDPFLHTAITALDFTGYKDPLTKAAGWFKKMLTIGVTADPRFALRLAIRDSEQAISTAPMSYNMISNIRTGFAMADLPGAVRNVGNAIMGRELQRLNISDEAANVTAGGGVMRLGSGSETGIRKTDLATMLDSPAKITAFWNRISTIARAYKEVTAQSEDINRFALYHKLRADGVPHDQAAFAARDLEDFTLRGAGPVARFLTQTVPFMNAWLQGLYKVVRSAVNADKNVAVAVGSHVAANSFKRVAIVLSATTLATLALDALYKDDEDYKKRTEYDRNANFWFKFGGVQFRVPMGFEVAALGRIAANGLDAFFDPEMTPRRFANNVGSIFATNMALNPTPQIVAPIIDLIANQSGTGAPIERMGSENLQPQERYDANSTLLARGISTAGSAAMRAVAGPQANFLSPVQLDYLTNAYFGWLGSVITESADYIARSVSNEPVRPSMDLWNRATGGMIATQTTPQSRYTDLLYQQADGINRAFATFEDLRNRYRGDEATSFLNRNRDLIAKHGLINQVTKFESNANQQIRRIQNRTDISAEQKQVAIMQLNAQKNAFAEQVFGAHPP